MFETRRQTLLSVVENNNQALFILVSHTVTDTKNIQRVKIIGAASSCTIVKTGLGRFRR